MSDWKKRARVISTGDGQPPSDWRSRAKVIEAGAPKATASQPETQQEAPSTSFGVGGLDAASFGFSDEIAGGIDAATTAARKFAGVPTEYTSPAEAYKATRDDWRKFSKAAQQNKGSYLAGSLAGGLATAKAVPAMGAGVIGKFVAPGAVMGAASGLGRSEADTAGGMAKDTATGAAIGGALSGLIGGASGAVANSETLKKLSALLTDKAKTRWVKTLNPRATDLRREMGFKTGDELAAFEKAKELAWLARQRGQLRAFDSPASADKRLAAYVADQAKQQTDALGAMEAAAPGARVQFGRVPERLAAKLEAEAVGDIENSAKLQGLPHIRALLEKVAGDRPSMRLSEAWAQKQALGRLGYDPTQIGRAQAMVGRDAERIVREEIAATMRAAAEDSPDVAQSLGAFEAANKKLAETIPLRDLAASSTGRDAVNRALSLTDNIYGAAGLGAGIGGAGVPGGGLTGYLAALVANQARTRGSSLVGAGLERAAGAPAAINRSVGAIGPRMAALLEQLRGDEDARRR